ncbi:MAG: sigma-54-dependent Fis family transcriptional regulator, partial [Pseudomonadota bacterium]
MRHEDRVFAALGSRRMAARDRIAASWQRSAARYGLDPGADAPQHVASARELHTRREASERLLRIAGSKLDQLFGLVGSSGCAVVLTDGDGVILDTRQRDADAAAFSTWGLLPGADWSEAREGTNGIGTCL